MSSNPVGAEHSSVSLDSNGKVPEFVCVDYPANVVNVDNMIATLGGNEMISEVYSESKRRLELRFRPSDIYCKPACGERTQTTFLLIKLKKRIKIRKKKGDNAGASSSSSDNITSTSITSSSAPASNLTAATSVGCSKEATSQKLASDRGSYASTSASAACSRTASTTTTSAALNSSSSIAVFTSVSASTTITHTNSISSIASPASTNRISPFTSASSASIVDSNSASFTTNYASTTNSTSTTTTASSTSTHTTTGRNGSSTASKSNSNTVGASCISAASTIFSSNAASTSSSNTVGTSNGKTASTSGNSGSSCADSAAASSDVSYHTTLLGLVNTTYMFNSMCDAQYLPINTLMDDGSEQTLPYNCFSPGGLELPSWLHESPQCLFLPPAAFSRMDTPQHFFFRGDGSESFIKQEHSRSNKTRKSSTEQSAASEGTATSSAAPAGSENATTTAATTTSSNSGSTLTSSGGNGSGTIDATSAGNTNSTSSLMPSPTPNVIYKTRHRRTLFAIFRNYSEATPEAPAPKAIEQLQLKFLQRAITPIYKKLKELFVERPIWSKNALKVALGNSTDNLKFLLPTVGYYFSTGPWRNLWVKFGYDPRQDSNSFKYQTIDYRLKQTVRLKSRIEAKRSYSNYILPYKSSSASKRKVSVIQSDLLSTDHSDDINQQQQSTSSTTSPLEPSTSSAAASSPSASSPSVGRTSTNLPDTMKQTITKMKRDDEEYGELGDGDDDPIPEELGDAVSVFKPGTIPPYRQIFYQYIDINVAEIRNLLMEAVVAMKSNQRCDERYGWLSKAVEDECRRIMTCLIDEAVDRKTESEREASSSAATTSHS